MTTLDLISHATSRTPGSGRMARAFAIAFVVVLGACDAYALGDGGASSAIDSDLTVAFAAPINRADVSIPFDVTLDANVALGEPDSGNHHVHLFFDTDTDSAEYDIVYGTSAQVSRELTPGEHTIIASLRNADHSDAGASQTITVVVSDESGLASSGSPTPPSGDGY